MQKWTRRTFLLLSGFFALILTSCWQFQFLPRPIGQQVKYSNKELSAIFDGLSFANEKNSVIETKINVTNEEKYYAAHTKIRQNELNILDLENEERHTDIDVKYTVNDGSIDAKVDAFQDNNKTYFTMKHHTNKKFYGGDEHTYLNREITDGNYFIMRDLDGITLFTNSISNLTDSFMFFTEPRNYISFTNVERYFDDFKATFFELNEYDFYNFKLFEKNDYFSVSLKVTRSDFTKEKASFRTAMERTNYVLLYNLDNLESYELEIVFIFENNAIKEFGIKNSFRYQDKKKTEGYSLLAEDVFVRTKYISRPPRKGNYDKYIEINEFMDLYEPLN